MAVAENNVPSLAHLISVNRIERLGVERPGRRGLRATSSTVCAFDRKAPFRTYSARRATIGSTELARLATSHISNFSREVDAADTSSIDRIRAAGTPVLAARISF